nr:hypothetical protein [Tanacetum cinerariifolium]
MFEGKPMALLCDPPPAGVRAVDIRRLCENVIDLRLVHPTMLYEIGLMTIWKHAGHHLAFKDGERNACLSFLNSPWPCPQGKRTIARHTTQPLPSRTPILNNSDHQKEGPSCQTKEKKTAPISMVLSESDADDSNQNDYGTYHFEEHQDTHPGSDGLHKSEGCHVIRSSFEGSGRHTFPSQNFAGDGAGSFSLTLSLSFFFIMGEPSSPNRGFDFPGDKLEPHPAYDFFAPRPLPRYGEWLEANDYLLGELEAMVDEPMAVPAIEEVAEPVAEAEEEQMAAPVIDMEEDLAVLFGEDDDFEDGDFSDDDYEGVEEEKVWKVNEEWMMAPVTPPSVPAVQPSSVYEVGVIEDLSTRLGNLEYGYGQLVKKVIQVMASQMVHATDRLEQVDAQVKQGQQTATQRDETITELTQQVQVLQAAV